MKSIFTLLVLSLFLSLNLTAQFQKSGYREAGSADSLLLTMGHQPKALPNTPGFKSFTPIKQKMDSLLVQRYNAESGELTIENKGRYAYDSEGRLILTVEYTNNTMDGEYIWLKDTQAFATGSNVTFWESYERKLETDPWLLKNKVERAFDEHGNDTLIVQHSQDWETDEWLQYKTVKVFNAKNNYILSVSYWKFDTATEWTKISKSEPEYDDDGNEISTADYTWDEAVREWIHTGQTEYTYDTKGRNLSSVGYNYDTEAKVWTGWRRDETQYDSQGNEILSAYYGWNYLTEAWEVWQKTIQVFSAKNLLTEQTIYSMNGETSELDPQRKETLAYNPEGLLIQHAYYLWNTSEKNWRPIFESLNTYDSKGHQIITESLNWNTALGAFIKSSRQELAYDEYGNLIHSTALSKPDSIGKWNGRFEAVYSYNYAFMDTEVITPYGWSGIPPVHMLVKSEGKRYDNATGNWIPSHYQDFYYSEFGTSTIPEEILSTVSVFPNPANDHLYIQLENSSEPMWFQLQDLTGREVLSQQITGPFNQLSVRELPTGLYIYRITCNGKFQSGKIVKK